MNTVKAILIGRHIPDMGNTEIEVIEQKNILWSTDLQECENQWDELWAEAREKQANVLLQNVPGILGIALMKFAATVGTYMGSGNRVGFIISVPGERKAQVPLTVELTSNDKAEVEKLIKHANGRAKVEFGEEHLAHNPALGVSEWALPVTVTVDPVPEFIFSHIEWF